MKYFIIILLLYDDASYYVTQLNYLKESWLGIFGRFKVNYSYLINIFIFYILYLIFLAVCDLNFSHNNKHL